MFSGFDVDESSESEPKHEGGRPENQNKLKYTKKLSSAKVRFIIFI